MLMSNQQKYAVDVIERLGCLRERQLQSLLQGKFFAAGKAAPDNFTDMLLRQLQYGNAPVHREQGLVFTGRPQISQAQLEAIDVMIELSEGRPSDFYIPQKERILLRFSTESPTRIHLFACVSADFFTGRDVRAPPFSATERVIILLPADTPPPLPAIKNPVFYAVLQPDGTHRFFTKDHT